MATLLVVRHAEAEGNGSHRFLGQSQVPLTANGHRQAELLADRLADVPITKLVASDLQRTISTLEPLARRLAMAIEPDPRLREIDNGAWTGLIPGEIADGWPAMWADYVAGADVARPGGERWSDVAGRVVPAAEQLLSGEGTVVVCTHGGPALVLATWAAGLASKGNIFAGRLGALDNTSITVIDPGPRLVAFNDVGHLRVSPDPSLPFAPTRKHGTSG